MSPDPIRNPVVDPATVATLVKQNEELVSRLNTALDRITGLETASATSGHMTRQISDDVTRQIAKADVIAFLELTMPATVLFALPSHEGFGSGAFRKVCLICDKTMEDTLAKRKVTIPPVWVNFEPWVGAGSELRHPETKRLWKFGWADFLKDSRNPITVTKADIKTYNLNERETPTRTGQYTIAECMAALKLTKVWAQHKVIPAPIFQAMMRARYEGLWDQMERNQKIQRAIAELDNPDQVKSGQIEMAVR